MSKPVHEYLKNWLALSASVLRFRVAGFWGLFFYVRAVMVSFAVDRFEPANDLGTPDVELLLMLSGYRAWSAV